MIHRTSHRNLLIRIHTTLASSPHRMSPVHMICIFLTHSGHPQNMSLARPVKTMQERLTRLLEWGEKNNCEIAQSVQFQYSQERGYHAVSSSRDDSEFHFIQISPTVLFTPVRALEFFKAKPENDTEIQSLCKLFLCHEKFIKDSSFWSPYIDSLPSAKEIDTPFHWCAELRDSLGKSNLGNSLPSALKTVIQQWRAALELVPQDLRPSSFSQDYSEGMSLLIDPFADTSKLFPQRGCSWTSFPLYLWAHVVFTSRAFPYRIVDRDYGNVSMLIPIMDLLNHNPQSKIDTFQNDSGLVLRQCETILEGCEIPYNYGKKSNEELLLGYGFVIEDNPDDHVTFKVVPLESDNTLDVPKDGLYHATRSDIIPQGLLDFCSYIDSGYLKTGITLPMRLNGVTRLRSLLHSRLALVSDIPGSGSWKSQIYLKGQKDLIRSMLKELKRIEKFFLTEYRDCFVTYKTIVSHYSELREDDASRDDVIAKWVAGLDRGSCFEEALWLCDVIEEAQETCTTDAPKESVVETVIDHCGWMRSNEGPLVLVKPVFLTST